MNKEIFDNLKRREEWQTVYEEYILPELERINKINESISIPPFLDGITPETKMICKAVLLENIMELLAPLADYTEVEKNKLKNTRFN